MSDVKVSAVPMSPLDGPEQELARLRQLFEKISEDMGTTGFRVELRVGIGAGNNFSAALIATHALGGEHEERLTKLVAPLVCKGLEELIASLTPGFVHPTAAPVTP